MINESSIITYSNKNKKLYYYAKNAFPFFNSDYLFKKGWILSYKYNCSRYQKEMLLQLFIDQFKIDFTINDITFRDNKYYYVIDTLK